MSDNKELKPCPFCGGEARIESNRDWHKLTGDHDDQCVFFEEEVVVGPAQDEHRAAMIADWNRRAAQPVVLSDEQISDLKDAIGETEYKYFGCYEFSESQHTAVDVLVEVARMVIAAKEQA